MGRLNPGFLAHCIDEFQSLAKLISTHIVLVPLANISDQQPLLPFNNAMVISSSGRIGDAYAKVHLFSPAKEHLFVAPGTCLVLFAVRDFSVHLLWSEFC